MLNAQREFWKLDRTRLIDVSPQREIISGMEDVLHRRQTYIFRREFNKFTNPTGEYIPSIRDVFEGVPNPDETPCGFRPDEIFKLPVRQIESGQHLDYFNLNNYQISFSFLNAFNIYIIYS